MKIVDTLLHHVRVAHARLRAQANRVTRSPRWRYVEHAHLQIQPQCAACGGTDHVQVHHVQPFHLHPELELDFKNLISLCAGSYDCHLLIGHGGSWRAYSETVVADAAEVRADPTQRDRVVSAAKLARQA